MPRYKVSFEIDAKDYKVDDDGDFRFDIDDFYNQYIWGKHALNVKVTEVEPPFEPGYYLRDGAVIWFTSPPVSSEWEPVDVTPKKS